MGRDGTPGRDGLPGVPGRDGSPGRDGRDCPCAMGTHFRENEVCGASSRVKRNPATTNEENTNQTFVRWGKTRCPEIDGVTTFSQGNV